MSSDEWGWYPKDGGSATGGFATREEAVADAVKFYQERPRTEVLVGKFTEVDPEDWVPSDVDDVLDRMVEDIEGNLYLEEVQCELDEDPTKRQEAENEYKEAMRAWARKWVNVEPARFICGENAEAVKVGTT